MTQRTLRMTQRARASRVHSSRARASLAHNVGKKKAERRASHVRATHTPSLSHTRPRSGLRSREPEASPLANGSQHYV